MHNARFENKRTADMALLGVFSEAVNLTPDFFVLLLEALTTLISFTFTFTFDVEPEFFIFLDPGSSSELSWSLASAFDFLRLLDFPPSGSGRAVRFFGGERICSAFLSA